jgi:hypothetical protein
LLAKMAQENQQFLMQYHSYYMENHFVKLISLNY